MKSVIYKSKVYILFAFMFLAVSSCEIFDLDVNTDPNNPAQASFKLLLPNAQLEGIRTFAGPLNDAAMGFVGLVSANDNHDMTSGTWNTSWNILYSGPLADLDRIIVAAEEQQNSPHYLGIAQVMKAYYFSLMVDLWGNVPYFDAFKGDGGIKEAAFDDQKLIYADLISLCEKAVANFALNSAVAVGDEDLIYQGDIDRWIKAANSMKLKLLLQVRRSPDYADAGSKIQALIDDGNLILSPDDDFTFKFGKLLNPDDRHPMYQQGYASGEAAYSYYGHQFMAEMLANRDPRTPYYFKRQSSDVLDPADPTQKQTMPCSQRSDCVYNYFPVSPLVSNAVFGDAPSELTPDEKAFLAGFLGRDRSDPSGVPNDNLIRATVGAYPAGGLVDDKAEAGGGNKGAGDGIFPIISSWMMKFYLIEAILELGVTVPDYTVETLLEEALYDQTDAVFALGATSDATGVANIEKGTTDWPSSYEPANVDDFVATVLDDYAAAGASQKLNFVLKQAWFANYGNGYEIYTTFRRTGFPNSLQTPLQTPRQFALRLPYTQDELNLNPNTPKTVVYDSPNDALFWDVIKYQF